MPRPVLIGQTNLDADQLVFFKQQLQHHMAKSFDVKYPTPMATSLFPVSVEAGPGAETIVYDQFDSIGVVKFITDYADDLPRSDVKGKQFSIIIQSLGGSYGWSIQEVRSAAMAKRNLNGMRAAAARRSNDIMVNKIAWHADGSANWAGLVGILRHPNVTKISAASLTAAADDDGIFSSAAPDKMIEIVNNAIQSVPDLTNGLEVIDTLLFPPKQYGLLATTPRSSHSDTTVLKFLKEVNPNVTFGSVNELKNVVNPRTGSGTVDCMLGYRRSADHMQLHIPIIYEQFAAQERNLSYIVPTHSRIAGFNIPYPLSVVVVDGI